MIRTSGNPFPMGIFQDPERMDAERIVAEAAKKAA
jgi:hypothetical protein